jgi:hypothetical protein
LEQTLAPVRKGARVIREIAWRLREIGADGRICDLIDSQVSAIEAGCGQLAATDPKPAVSAVFDLIEQRIGQFDDRDTVSPQIVEEVIRSPSPAPTDQPPAAVAETVEAAVVTAEATEADDDAVLEMVALEMAEPDLAEPEPVAAAEPPPTIQPSLQPSLGASLIASGIVRRPQASQSDPLAPIRRMSQAEKIAFFS